jgi:hypothetical protein
VPASAGADNMERQQHMYENIYAPFHGADISYEGDTPSVTGRYPADVENYTSRRMQELHGEKELYGELYGEKELSASAEQGMSNPYPADPASVPASAEQGMSNPYPADPASVPASAGDLSALEARILSVLNERTTTLSMDANNKVAGLSMQFEEFSDGVEQMAQGMFIVDKALVQHMDEIEARLEKAEKNLVILIDVVLRQQDTINSLCEAVVKAPTGLTEVWESVITNAREQMETNLILGAKVEQARGLIDSLQEDVAELYNAALEADDPGDDLNQIVQGDGSITVFFITPPRTVAECEAFDIKLSDLVLEAALKNVITDVTYQFLTDALTGVLPAEQWKSALGNTPLSFDLAMALATWWNGAEGESLQLNGPAEIIEQLFIESILFVAAYSTEQRLTTILSDADASA